MEILVYLHKCSSTIIKNIILSEGGFQRVDNFKFILHHIASCNASKCKSRAIKGDGGNECTSWELLSGPHLDQMAKGDVMGAWVVSNLMMMRH